MSKINLLEAKLKSYRLAALTEDSSEQPSIDCVMWFIVASLMQMYNEKEKLSKDKYKMYSLRRKGEPGKCSGITQMY